ncbi:hypothetical protein C0Q70_12197 [Pomacea canaliculata]|uniref:Major facilitator superfamily (MFS) profile domain-containing protein n=1 Tax=Pomacea canaliculata TaxID=400727 RepID=A0A2T7P0U6_POMCA|nr:hypothetical protein C0Q70_12197 [Pomacea canaliculata]
MSDGTGMVESQITDSRRDTAVERRRGQIQPRSFGHGRDSSWLAEPSDHFVRSNTTIDAFERGSSLGGLSYTGPSGKSSPGRQSHREKVATDTLMDSDYQGRAPECGLGCIKPPARRKLTNMATFSGIYAISALLTSTLSAYVNGQVTTIERHFGFSSEQTGLIMAANDIGFLVIVLFVSYIATRVHIPRFMGYATLLFGIFRDSLRPAPVSLRSPESIRRHRDGERETIADICQQLRISRPSCFPATGDTSSVSNRARANAVSALVIIVLGMVLQGVAKAPRHPLITTFVDNNIDKTKTGFYMGTTLQQMVLERVAPKNKHWPEAPENG